MYLVQILVVILTTAVRFTNGLVSPAPPPPPPPPPSFLQRAWDALSRQSPSTSSFNGGSTVAEPTVEDGNRFLQELNLQASVTPARFGIASPEVIPFLFTAAVGTALRLGSGIWGLQYSVSLTKFNPTEYAVTSLLGNSYQTNETVAYDGCSRVLEFPLILYDSEDSPECRLVREACSMLSLNVTIRPIPQGGKRFRRDLEEINSGIRTVPSQPPRLVDPNTGREISQWTNIRDYLFLKYGDNRIPWTLKENIGTISTATLSTLCASSGRARLSNAPKLPLLLWSYEGSPFCKRVRNQLNQLELEHTVCFTPRGSPNRQRFFRSTQGDGRFQVPFLQDPNTGVELFESEAIVEYLEKVYACNVVVDYM